MHSIYVSIVVTTTSTNHVPIVYQTPCSYLIKIVLFSLTVSILLSDEETAQNTCPGLLSLLITVKTCFTLLTIRLRHTN